MVGQNSQGEIFLDGVTGVADLPQKEFGNRTGQRAADMHCCGLNFTGWKLIPKVHANGV